MSIAAANVTPNFNLRRRIVAEDLLRLVEPAVIFEYQGLDSDNEHFFVYTVAGWLDGQNIATIHGGATIGGDVIVIIADSREQADLMAGLGLEDTINGLHGEEAMIDDAMAAQARLASVGTLDRMDLAIDAKNHPAYVEDAEKIRSLRGDDIILTTGH